MAVNLPRQGTFEAMFVRIRLFENRTPQSSCLMKDIAKGQAKKLCKQIVQLRKDLVPVILNTVTQSFFKSLLYCRTGAKQILL